MTYSEAIEQVMLHNGYYAPLKLIYDEIWKYLDKNSIAGKTPDKTIQERVQRDKRFTRMDSGVYALTEYLDKIPKDMIPSKASNFKHNESPINHIESESDFFRFMTSDKSINNKSRTNYLSWLRFLSQKHTIDSSLTKDGISEIIEKEKEYQKSRKIYNTQRDLGNFKSALRKYLSFIDSDYTKIQDETILSEIKKVEKNDNLEYTEIQSIKKSRIGQGLFRNNLIQYWKGCSISGYQFVDILIASHIKPWVDSNNTERLNTYNGLLLLPNFDKLFDKGYISFNSNGKIIFSRFFPETDRHLLNITPDTALKKVEEKHFSFLKYHNDNCLIQ